ncbi:MAG: shikimate dehydrogenase substrate binding domain protein [Alphaproteobacteria bacterium]|nr:shikimate dehydrogenase substrate binding domain protein [Alphaproteobacteria bacterium]
MTSQRTAHTASPTRSTLVGLLGTGIGPSRSPEIHEAEAAALGFPLVYRTLDFDALRIRTDDIPQVLKWAQAFGFAGLNVTHPLKKRVIDYLDELSPEAEALEAVNTVVFADGKSFGHNTDWSGYSRNFTRSLPQAALDRVAQIGAGGAGAAVAFAMLGLGTRHLSLFDVRPESAAQLADRLADLFPDRTISVATNIASVLAGADGLVQTSPLGMTGYPGSPLDLSLLRPDLWVSEIIYFPAETELLRAARARGCATVSGEGMVVQQAADAFELFTGRKPDVERMLARFALSTQQEQYS